MSKKSVTIKIDTKDLQTLRGSNDNKNPYNLCVAKKVNDAYTVIWQSTDTYGESNNFSWSLPYQLFGTTVYAENDVENVLGRTNAVDITVAQSATLAASGALGQPVVGGSPTGFTLENENVTGGFRPGVSQPCMVAGVEALTSSIYIGSVMMEGPIPLAPSDWVKVWFEQHVQTGIFLPNYQQKGAKSYPVEIDLTKVDTATCTYSNQEWTKTA